MQDTMMSAAERIADWYLAAWNSGPGPARWQYLLATWSEHGRFRDPFVQLHGREALNRHISDCRQLCAGSRFELTAAAVTQDRGVRFSWALLAAGGTELLGGVSVGEIDDCDRILQLVVRFRPCQPAQPVPDIRRLRQPAAAWTRGVPSCARCTGPAGVTDEHVRLGSQ